MRLRTPAQRFTFWLAVFILLVLAINGLVVISQFTGYAMRSYAAEGGTITELVIQHNIPTLKWAGVFGIAVRVQGYDNLQYTDLVAGEMDESNLLFNCMQKDIEHEIYATTIDPNVLALSNLYPMNPGDLDAALGRDPNDYDSATNTFTQVITFDYGTTSVTAPGTATYAIDEGVPTKFRIALTKTQNNTPVFVAIITNFTKGFNNRTYNYQLILPALVGNSTYYYLFTDPNDVCGEGEGENPPPGTVYGTVTTTAGAPIPGVLVEVAGFAGLTNSTGQYLFNTSIGNHNIYGVKTGYKVYKNNVTIFTGNATRHDFVLQDDTIPNTNTGIGPGTDSAGDTFSPPVPPAQAEGGQQTPTAAPSVQQPKVIEGQDYIVTLVELNRKLRLGQFLQEKIAIYSFRKGTAHVTFTLNGTGLENLITVDKQAIDIEPNGKGEFILTIFGVGDLGTFNGTIELEGDMNATIPVTIEVLPREQLPVEALQVQIETSEKVYYPGDTIRVKTDLRNMLTDREYPVRMLFTAQSLDGNTTLWTYETNAFIKTAFTLIKSFKLPSGVDSGDYVIRVTTYYLDMNGATSTIFHVAVPFWQRSLFGLKYWMWFLILLGIGGIVGAVILIRRNLEAKKKYHLKVEYDELPKVGPRSIPVGKIAETDHLTYMNLENFKTHTIVAGSTGGGKSVSAQVIIEEMLEKGVAVLVFDPTAQWTGMLRPCKDRTMLSLYPLFGMKPGDAKAFNGNIRQINDAREKIDIKKYVRPGEIQVFACHKLDPRDMDILVANAIRAIFHAQFPEEKLLKVIFVFDEVHRLLPKFGGSGDGFLQIERGCREFRKWGLGIMLISQVLSDFVGTIKANINTEIQMRTRDEGDLERIRQKYGEEVLRSLVKATVGSGMVENPAYNRGRPYFIAFRPLKHSVERLSDDEIEQYNTFNDQIDNLFYSLEQLEQAGVDIFDLKLELKLAQDKVKTGNFNMVKIYLEGLAPRIDKQWEKIGKKPKQLVRELVDMSAIQAELKQAQQERDKYVAQTAAAAGGAAGGPAAKKEWGWKDDVPPNKILNLKNGMIVISLSSLYDEVTAMKDNDLPKEFDPEPKVEEGKPPKQPINRFAQWVLDVTGDTKLAYALAAAKTKPELLKVLDAKKAGQPIPDAKPPAWFLQGAAPAAPASVAAPSAPVTPVATPVAPAAPVSAAPVSAAPVVPVVQTEPAVQPPVSTVTVASIPPVPIPVEQAQIPPAVPAPQPVVQAPQPTPPAQQPAPVPVVNIVKKPAFDLEALVVQNDQEAFRLENGLALRSVKELYEYLPRMEEWMFKNHVGQNYNHFADWIRGVFHNDALAQRVANAHTKEEMQAALNA